MTRLADIEAHVANIAELHDIVGAMRALASMRVQEAQHALPGVRRYAETMAGAIGAALLLAPAGTPAQPASGRRALVLCTAEHGFVGAFNERILAAARAVREPGDALFVLGARGAALAQEHGQAGDWVYSMATRSAGAPETVRHLLAALYRLMRDREITRIEAIFARHCRAGTSEIEHRLIFPIDRTEFAPARARVPPLHNLPPERLLEKLIGDYVFARLTEAVVELLASENAARFAAMETAHDNVSKKLDQLRQDARLARQNEITTELLDLVTGSMAQLACDPDVARSRLPQPSALSRPAPPAATGNPCGRDFRMR